MLLLLLLFLELQLLLLLLLLLELQFVLLLQLLLLLLLLLFLLLLSVGGPVDGAAGKQSSSRLLQGCHQCLLLLIFVVVAANAVYRTRTPGA